MIKLSESKMQMVDLPRSSSPHGSSFYGRGMSVVPTFPPSPYCMLAYCIQGILHSGKLTPAFQITPDRMTQLVEEEWLVLMEAMIIIIHHSPNYIANNDGAKILYLNMTAMSSSSRINLY